MNSRYDQSCPSVSVCDDRIPIDGAAFYQLPILERAARSAVGCWFNTEEKLCNAIQNANSPDEIFPDGWFRYWGVGRTFRTAGNRERMRELLYRAIPRLTESPPALELVEELSEEIRHLNCGWRPTSLVSKFAFSWSPSMITPYDRLARGQLRTAEHQYLSYANAFAKKRDIIEQTLRDDGLSPRSLPLDGKAMDEQLFGAHY
jgi:hypothetical protein